MKPLQVLFVLYLIIFAPLSIWFGLQLGDTTFPTEVLRAKLLTPEVEPGGELLTQRWVKRIKLCNTTIERMMFDGADIRHDSLDEGLGTITYPNGTGILGEDTFIGRQIVPRSAKKGQARYVALVCYRCNLAQWIWPLCEPPREQYFTIK